MATAPFGNPTNPFRPRAGAKWLQLAASGIRVIAFAGGEPVYDCGSAKLLGGCRSERQLPCASDDLDDEAAIRAGRFLLCAGGQE